VTFLKFYQQTIKKWGRNEVMRLGKVGSSCSTEVVLLLKWGINEVIRSGRIVSRNHQLQIRPTFFSGKMVVRRRLPSLPHFHLIWSNKTTSVAQMIMTCPNLITSFPPHFI
jgi:hypothetical protein